MESERRLKNVLTRDIDRLREKEKSETLEKTFESAAQVECNSTTDILDIVSKEEESEDDADEDVARTPHRSSTTSADVADLSRFSGNFSMKYVDYFVSQLNHGRFRAQDYSWDKQYSMWVDSILKLLISWMNSFAQSTP